MCSINKYLIRTKQCNLTNSRTKVPVYEDALSSEQPESMIPITKSYKKPHLLVTNQNYNLLF